jgi:hypothetical protein
MVRCAVACSEEDLKNIQAESTQSAPKKKYRKSASALVFAEEADSVSPQPVALNPESKEERQKRLAKRKAKTLKAFQLTYKSRREKSV